MLSYIFILFLVWCSVKQRDNFISVQWLNTSYFPAFLIIINFIYAGQYSFFCVFSTNSFYMTTIDCKTLKYPLSSTIRIHKLNVLQFPWMEFGFLLLCLGTFCDTLPGGVVLRKHFFTSSGMLSIYLDFCWCTYTGSLRLFSHGSLEVSHCNILYASISRSPLLVGTERIS